MKKIVWIIGLSLTLVLCSCSNEDYLNAIPRNSIALISIDVNRMDSSSTLFSEFDGCGIDLDTKVFLFETTEGSFGLCARIEDADALRKWLKKKSEQGECEQVIERKGISFALYHRAWQMGFNDNTLLVLGPIIATQQSQSQLQIATYLKQDEKRGIRESRMYQRLDSLGAPVSMVVQTAALPEKFVAPFMLGAPADADASQVLIAAKLSVADTVLHIDGNTFSFNKRIENALRSSDQILHTLEGTYLESINEDDQFCIMMNANGKQLLPLLHENKGLKALMAGMNLTVNFDSILNTVDGDMVFRVNDQKPSFLANNKTIASSNSSLTSKVPHDTMTSRTMSETRTTPLIGEQLVRNKRLFMLIQLKSLGEEISTTAASFLEPLFGHISTIVYTQGNE